MEHPGEEVIPPPPTCAVSLWRNTDFFKFWLGMNISFVGTQVTALAFPLLAVVTLGVTTAQMGTLRATASVASALAGPFAGVFVDRLRRRPVLIGTDLGLALLAGSIPLAAVFGLLRIEYLYVVQFLSGTLSIFSEVAMMSYLPSLVRRGQLVEANSKIQASSSAVSIAGPGLAGLLVQLLTAPVAIALDAVSFLLSSLSMWTIRAPEPEPIPARERRGVWAEIVEGLRVVYGHVLLRPLAESIALHFFFSGIIYTIFVLYAVRELGITPAALGIILGALGPGFMLGALLAPRAAKRFGVGSVMTWAPLLTAAGMSLIPLAAGGKVALVATFAAAHFLVACGIQLHGVNLMSLRQAVTPHRLQGRMNASFRFVNLFTAALGALTAGWLGESIGLRPTLAVGACGLLLPFLRLLFSPVRNLREQPVAEQVEGPL